MNHKPDQPTLMAYLFQELEEEKVRWVEAYLQEHPEVKAELEALSEIHHLMKKGAEEEVPPLLLPEVYPPQPTPHRNLWLRLGSIAACLTLLVLLISWVGLQVQYRNQTLTIQLGKSTEDAIPRNEQAPPVEHTPLIRQVVQQEIEALQDSLSGTLHQLQQLQTALQAQIQQDSLRQKELTRLARDYQKETSRLVSEIISQASRQQQQYTDELLEAFSQHTARQRVRDLQLIEETLLNIQQNTQEKQQQTEFIVTQLYTQFKQKNDEK